MPKSDPKIQHEEYEHSLEEINKKHEQDLERVRLEERHDREHAVEQALLQGRNEGRVEEREGHDNRSCLVSQIEAIQKVQRDLLIRSDEAEDETLSQTLRERAEGVGIALTVIQTHG